jgi:hypothetical protein
MSDSGERVFYNFSELLEGTRTNFPGLLLFLYVPCEIKIEIVGNVREVYGIFKKNEI